MIPRSISVVGTKQERAVLEEAGINDPSLSCSCGLVQEGTEIPQAPSPSQTPDR